MSMQLVTRSAVKRLVILFLVLLVLMACGWWSMIRMPLKSFRGPLPPLSPQQTALRDELRRHVEKLGGEIGERNVYQPRRLRAATEYVEDRFTAAGFKVRRQSYTVMGEACHNLEVELPGKNRRGEIVVIGAHYDSVSGSPGANDNGTGVAGVLALARAWAGRAPERTVRFVAFVNEEPPFFQTAQMGSLVYAKSCRERGDKIVAMLNLETMGCFSSEKRSQKYPFPMGLFYPSRGDFIGFVGNTASGGLVRHCLKVFREQASFPSEGGALPGVLPGIGWSDHWSFWQAGYPALMVTDTAPFRYAHYHTAADTPDKVDYDRLARVVDGVDKVITGLANP
jgi:Zn-dependent M28 family amino/carboxypeptidase